MWKPASAYVFSSAVILPTSASPVVRPRARAVLVCARVWTLAVTQRVFRPVSLGSGGLASLALKGGKTALGSAIVRGCGMRRVSPRAMGYSPLASPASAHRTQWMAAVAPRSPGVMPTRSCRVGRGRQSSRHVGFGFPFGDGVRELVPRVAGVRRDVGVALVRGVGSSGCQGGDDPEESSSSSPARRQRVCAVRVDLDVAEAGGDGVDYRPGDAQELGEAGGLLFAEVVDRAAVVARIRAEGAHEAVWPSWCSVTAATAHPALPVLHEPSVKR